MINHNHKNHVDKNNKNKNNHYPFFNNHKTQNHKIFE